MDGKKESSIKSKILFDLCKRLHTVSASMSNITFDKQGARVYVRGNTFPIKDAIKDAGGHWDGEQKAWWVGCAKAEKLKAVVDQGQTKSADDRDNPQGEATRVIGKASYKGKSYFVVWQGKTTKGEVFKLSFRDGSKTFWADASEAQWEKRYQEPKTIRDIHAYAEKVKANGGAPPRRVNGFGKYECEECGDMVLPGSRCWETGASH